MRGYESVVSTRGGFVLVVYALIVGVVSKTDRFAWDVDIGGVAQEAGVLNMYMLVLVLLMLPLLLLLRWRLPSMLRSGRTDGKSASGLKLRRATWRADVSFQRVIVPSMCVVCVIV
jgi:hypothetical protein